MFYRLGASFFRLLEFTGGWRRINMVIQRPHLQARGGNDLGFNLFYRSIHFITAFYHEQTGAIIFWVNDRWYVWRLKEGKKDAMLSR